MDDTIYRQAAIDAVHEEFDERLVWDESGEYTADEVERILDRLPSAWPETTRKVLASSRGGTTMWYKCEKCGEAADLSDNYCRCCGRRFLNGGPYKQTGSDRCALR